MARLRKHYETVVKPALQNEFNYANPMQIPKLEKIVINMGVSASLEKSAVDDAAKDLTAITGRKPIITKVIQKEKRGDAYEKMCEQLQEGRQAYVICPRIDEPDPDKAFALQA